MEFRINISTGNAAFDGDNCGPEIIRVLERYIAKRKRCPDLPSTRLRDSNGNTVGRAGFQHTEWPAMLPTHNHFRHADPK